MYKMTKPSQLHTFNTEAKKNNMKNKFENLSGK